MPIDHREHDKIVGHAGMDPPLRKTNYTTTKKERKKRLRMTSSLFLLSLWCYGGSWGSCIMFEQENLEEWQYEESNLELNE